MYPRTTWLSEVGCPRRGWGCLLLALCCLSLSACAEGGHFTLLGYTTLPNYDTRIRTVRVPIFKNNTFRRGLEFDLTREVCKQIEQKTPFKVVGENQPADTELLCTITVANKNIINRNQLNEVREAETNLVVELVWRDLNTGEILSRPREGTGAPPVNLQLPSQPVVTMPTQGNTLVLPPLPGAATPVQGPTPPPGSLPAPNPGDPIGPPAPPPVIVVQSLGGFIPEVGESITTSFQKNVHRLATQIVSQMEAPF